MSLGVSGLGCASARGLDLVSAMEDGNLRLFSDILSEDSVNVNHEYPEYNSSTILHLALSQPDREDFALRVLLHRDVNPNISHLIVRSFPIHVGAEMGSPEVIQALIDIGADVNARVENGNTALHFAALKSNATWLKDSEERREMQKKYAKCVEALLRQPNINVDVENNLGISPLYFAAEKGSEDVIRLLIQKGAYAKVTVDDESIEDHFRARFPKGTFTLTPANSQCKDTVENKLFGALYCEATKPGSFLAAYKRLEKSGPIKWNADNGAYSFLQYCCDMGFVDLVRFLIVEKGANPNYYCSSYQMPPILLAAHHGYYRILRIFKEQMNDVDFCAVDPIKRENILHKIIKKESKAYVNFEERNYDKCLALVLNDEPHFRALVDPIVNEVDHLGNTPLHVAAQLGQEEVVRKLLRSAGNIGIKNARGETPILHISPEVMEEYLDDCISGEGLSTDERFKIIFRYSFLGPPLMDNKQEKASLLRPEPRQGSKGQRPYNLPEAEPLWYMSQLPGHRALLTHPVITSFLCMKWRRMRHYFYLNLLFYLLFVGFFTSYLLMKFSETEIASETVNAFRVVVIVLLSILTVREFLQAFVSFRRYIFSMENLLEISLISLGFYISFRGDLSSESDRSTCVAGLLLSWAELVLLFGRHPKASTFVTMFKRISMNFILFLTWSISFIIAFALAFYIMLKRPPSADAEEQENPYFSTVERSLLKTLTMSLTGEIEFESIAFNLHFGRVVFLLYVFFIMLVLVNLLNGLAVSDISAIQKEAEIVSHVSRIELISYFESMLLGDPFQFLSNWPPFSWGRKVPDCSCLRGLLQSRFFLSLGSKRFLLFAERLVEKQAVFYPNRSRREKSQMGAHSSSIGLLDPEAIILDVEILEAAKMRLMKKQEVSLIATNHRINKMERSMRLMNKQQNYIIDLLNKMTSDKSAALKS